MSSQTQSIYQFFKIQLNELNKDKFASLLKWCEENGLLDSYEEIKNGNTNEKNYSKESIEFFDKMLERADAENKEGNGYSSEEVMTKLNEILNKTK